MRKLYENFHILYFQKRIVSADTIRGNKVHKTRIMIFHNPCYQCAAESQPAALASNTSLSSSIHTVSGGSDPHKRLCNAIAIAKKGYNPLCSKKRALIGEENTVGDSICKEGFASTNGTFMLTFCDPFLIYFRRCSQYIAQRAFNPQKI